MGLVRNGRAYAAAAAGAVTLVGGGALALRVPDGDAQAAAGRARIVFLNVGQGDATLINVGGKFILNDAGEYAVDEVDRWLRKWKAKQIDVAILSHPHDDHVKNFIPLIEDKGWKIKLVVRSESAHWQGTDTNKRLMKLLREEGLDPPEIATRGERFSWGGASWLVLNPPRDTYTGGESESANASVALLFEHNGVEVLFTGDVGPSAATRMARELEHVAEAVDDPIDIFLATHHGAAGGSNDELLRVLRPRWAVVSAGDKNRFKHPSPEAIARLKTANAGIWCTARSGSLVARISAAGKLTWSPTSTKDPWWSRGPGAKRKGICTIPKPKKTEP
jgi:competence protein ComEC